MGGMVIGKSQPCCAWKAGVLTTRGSSAYGTKKVYSCRAGTRRANGFIIKTAPSSGCGPHIPTIFGRSTLCTISLAMGAAIKCSRF
nr:hypothetical protein [uncultured bacterium]